MTSPVAVTGPDAVNTTRGWQRRPASDGPTGRTHDPPLRPLRLAGRRARPGPRRRRSAGPSAVLRRAVLRRPEMNMDDADPRGLETGGLSMEDACRGADRLAEVLRQDPTLPAHMAMVEAELHHRGLQGPRPQRWWKRARWLLWGKRQRRIERLRRLR